MTMILNNVGTQAELKLIDPSTKRSILNEFMAKCAKCAEHLDVNDLQFPVNDEKYYLLKEALKQEQISLNTIHGYSSKTDMELNDAIRNELNTAFKKELSQGSTLIEGIQKGVEAKSKIIDRLFNSEVIVKNPVNKKFWPLVNTSHTFAISHFEEIKGEDGSVTYKINAECDFTILMPNPKDNIDFHGKADLLMAMNHKNLVVIEESYVWPINFVAEEEKQMLEIIHDGIHHDFAMRGAFKEDAA
ncbi:hypothetical protein [uncultured Psychrobacter sp.]|uniref:hypothetical protein n=1 Tax=uncultured Psychrobacter sp. TaxID=259303 RepID=UPI0030D73EBA